MNLMKSLKKFQQSIALLHKENGLFSYRVLWLGIIGVLMLVFGSVFNGNVVEPMEQSQLLTEKTAEKVPEKAAAQSESGESGLESKLVRILSQVKGAGHVAVNINFAGSERQEYAKNKVNETKTTQEKDTSGGVRTTTESKESEQILLSKEAGTDKPIVLEQVHPEIKGVLVVAEGAASSAVKANLTKAVATGLGIPSYKITVLPQ